MTGERYEDYDVDPDVLEAKSATRKLLGALRVSTDSEIRKVFKKMIFDAGDFVKELKIRSVARKAARTLQESTHPVISKN